MICVTCGVQTHFYFYGKPICPGCAAGSDTTRRPSKSELRFAHTVGTATTGVFVYEDVATPLDQIRPICDECIRYGMMTAFMVRGESRNMDGGYICIAHERTYDPDSGYRYLDAKAGRRLPQYACPKRCGGMYISTVERDNEIVLRCPYCGHGALARI